MQLESFHRWIHHIYATRDEELDCEGFSRLIPQYVDMEVTGEQADRHFPDIKHHLSQCTECGHLYASLHDVAVMEISSQWTCNETATLSL